MVMTAMNEVGQVNKGFVRFGDWTAFSNRINSLTKEAFETEEGLCSALQLDEELYNRIISFSTWKWKDSPSKSLFNGLGFNGLDAPMEGQEVFNSFVAQTRFIMMLIEGRFLSSFAFETVRDENNEKVKVKGQYAQTMKKAEGYQQRFDMVLQVLYAYFLFCRKQEEKEGFKMPKKIYRGVRLRDVFWTPAIQTFFEKHEMEFKDKTHREIRKRKVDLLMQYIEDNGINDICENNLVSFTSSKAVAKYFANGEGLLIELNPKDVEVMTSEVHDERFAERDYVSGKLEKEYIVRVADDKVNPISVTIHDLDYFIETNNPLAVSLFDHDNKSATYELNGTRIKAYYIWTSNTTSAIRYKNLGGDSWGYSSKEFKEKFGFSPVLSGKTLKDIKDFTIHIN